jgi:hypothetical protein
MRFNRFLTAVALLALTATAASASQQGLVVTRQWHAMDLCAKQAQAAFPDFTADANAKRDAALQRCLAGQNLPPREPLAPQH